MAGTNLNADEILVVSRVTIWLGAVGATAPTDCTTAPTGHTAVGHTTEDSLSFETSPEFEEFKSAQSDFTVKKFQTTDAATVQVDLAQWNAGNFKAVYGGGTITEVSGGTGVFKFVPPRLGERTELSLIIDVSEGSKHYRYVVPKAAQSEGVSLALNKGATATLPLRLDILGGDGTDAWYLLTDDPAFDPTPVP